MTEALLAAAALLAGGTVAWVLATARAKAREAEARETEAQRHLAEQKVLLEETRARLAETFRAAAAEALTTSTAGFLTLAEEKFKPLAETLAAYQKEARSLEEHRVRDMTSVGAQLQEVARAQTALQSETARLVNALRSPQIRGRWGEITLRRTAELAGLSGHCDFVEQTSGGDGRLRPDMIVKLPAGREIIVDAKVPLGGYLEALEAVTEEAREAGLRKHAEQVQQHVVRLASRDYGQQFSSTLEFVVLFIPNDTFLAAAADKDPNLIEFALQRRIVIATPTTFIALLRAVAYGWRQELVAENAQRISELGQELYERMAVLAEHLGKIGSGLGRATEAYNDAVASLERRVLPAARRMKEYGAGGKKEIEQLPLLDLEARRILTPEDES